MNEYIKRRDEMDKKDAAVETKPKRIGCGK